MPTFKVTDPDTGRIVRITGDTRPTGDQLRKIFSRISDGSATPEPIERSGRPPLDIEANRDAALRELAESRGVLGSIGTGFDAGARTLQRAVGIMEPADDIEKRALAISKEVSPVSVAAGELLGESVPFVGFGIGAGAIPTVGGRVLASAGLGALESGAVSSGRDGDAEEVTKAAAIGGTVAGAAEAVLPRVISIGSSLVRRVLGKSPTSPVIDSAGNASQELTEALSTSGLQPEDLGREALRSIRSGERDLTQQARKAFLEQEGVRPTRAQVTRDASDFREQQELAKSSNLLRSRLEENEALLTSRFNNAIKETGGDVDLPSSSIIDQVVSKADKLDKDVSDLYRSARENAQTEKIVKLDSLVDALKSKAPQNRVTGGVIETIVGDLKEKGVIQGTGDKLRATGRVDVQAAEDTRKLMNELFDPQNGFRNSVLRGLKDKLDTDVGKAAGEDVFRKARRAKSDFEKGLARAKISKFDSRKKNLVRDMLENKINPDSVVDDVVFSKKWTDSDLSQLKSYVTDSPDGKKAFDDLRADTLQRITDKAFTGPVDSQGFQALSVGVLQRELSKLGKKKMDVLFTKPEQEFLSRMVKVGKLSQPTRGAALGRGPSAQAVSRLESLLSRVPMIGDAIGTLKIDREARNLLKAKPAKIPLEPRSTTAVSAGIGAEAGKAIAEDEQ